MLRHRSSHENIDLYKKGGMNLEARYTNGEHLEKAPDWHAHQSSWKVDHILAMLKKHELEPRKLCDVGCGAGEVFGVRRRFLPALLVAFPSDHRPSLSTP